jgi:hypothetical protein
MGAIYQAVFSAPEFLRGIFRMFMSMNPGVMEVELSGIKWN